MELNELSIAMAMGIDKADNGYRISVQIVDPGVVAPQKTGANRAPVTMYAENGRGIFDTMRKITTAAPRKIYLSHMRMVVIDEEVANDGIGEILDFLSRDHSMRSDFYLVVTRETKAEEALKVLTSIEIIPANKLYSSLEMSEQTWAPTHAVTIDELMEDLYAEGKNPVLTALHIRGDLRNGQTEQNVSRVNPLAQLQYQGLALFKNDRLVGWLNESESRGYNYLMGNVVGSVTPYPCGEKKTDLLMLEIIRARSSFQLLKQNGKPVLQVNVHIRSNLGETHCKVPLETDQDVTRLEKLAGEHMKNGLMAAVKKAKEFRTDIFGFGEFIHQEDPALWSRLEPDWSKHFATLDVRINVDLQIVLLGTIHKMPKVGIEE
jgi:spore germination protein KC